jgi:hypothetical protein
MSLSTASTPASALSVKLQSRISSRAPFAHTPSVLFWTRSCERYTVPPPTEPCTWIPSRLPFMVFWEMSGQASSTSMPKRSLPRMSLPLMVAFEPEWHTTPPSFPKTALSWM